MKHNSKRPEPAPGTGLDPDAFQELLGARLRTLRSRRGMSRKVLAKHSDISERYLAQLEAGEANCSIVLLRRIANAIGVQVTELVDERSERPLDLVFLEQFLGRLTPEQVSEARAMLIGHFEGKASEGRRDRIAFVGLRGAGKSTLGQMLAKRLNVPFLELDRLVEQQHGMSLRESFEMFGREMFRRTERATLQATLASHPSFVMATGGGIVAEPATFEMLLTSCLTVWVKAPPQEHMQRVIKQGDLRPMANNARAMDDLVAILASREPLYSRADIVIDTAGKTSKESFDELIDRLADAKPEPARRKRR